MALPPQLDLLHWLHNMILMALLTFMRIKPNLTSNGTFDNHSFDGSVPTKSKICSIMNHYADMSN